MAHRPGHFKPFTDFLNQGMQNTNQNIYDMSMPSYGYSQFNNPYGQNQPGFMTQGFDSPYQQIGIGGDNTVMGEGDEDWSHWEGEDHHWNPDFAPGGPHGDPDDYDPQPPPEGFDSWSEWFDHQEWLLTPEGQYQTHLDELTESGFYDPPDPGVGDPMGEIDYSPSGDSFTGQFDFGLDFGEEEIEEGLEGSILPPGYGEGPYEFGHEIDPFADDFVPGEGEYSQPDLAGLLTDLEFGIAGTGLFDDFDLDLSDTGEQSPSDFITQGFDSPFDIESEWGWTTENNPWEAWENILEGAQENLDTNWLEEIGLFDDFELSDLSGEDFGSALAEGQSPFDIESPNPWLEYAQSAELAEDLESGWESGWESEGISFLEDIGLFDDFDLDLDVTAEGNVTQDIIDMLPGLDPSLWGAGDSETAEGWSFMNTPEAQALWESATTASDQAGMLSGLNELMSYLEQQAPQHQYGLLEHAGGGGTGGGLAKRLFYPTQETGMAAVGSGAQGGNTGLEALMKALQGGG